jgi:hypothetical protein
MGCAGFVVVKSDAWEIAEIFIDVLFICDVLLNFRVAYTDHQVGWRLA